MTMKEIVSALAKIQGELNAIDLTKDKSADEIKKMATNPVQQIDKVAHDKGFNEEALDATIKMFENANKKVETYDPTQERAKAIQDKTKRKEILDKVKAKEEVKQKIKGKYEELARKKAVIDKYKEKFNPEHLILREERKLDLNDKKIETNEHRITEIIDFKDKINNELTDINNNLILIKELEEQKKQFKKLEDAKADLNAEKAKPDADKDFIKQYESHIKNQEAKFNDTYKKVTDKYKTISLDPKDISTSVTNAQNNAKTNINNAKTKIEGKLTNSEKTYGYTAGFETYMKNKIASTKTDEEYLDVFDNAEMELEAENINLNFENDKISENIEIMEKGQEILKNGKPKKYVEKEPTEEEIEDLINSDSEIRALAPVLTKKEMRQAVYSSLTKDKSGKVHPILFLKSFGKKAQSQWKESYEKDMREKAVEKIKTTKREAAKQTTKEVEAVESKRQKFMDTLFVNVMSADSKKVDKMDKDIEKGKPGETLTKVYNDMEK